ncbi:MAG: sugar ABC transporter permease [Clostridia bacterium]|nr:sugar ABC transporter permease [Clostridia bacterium]
MIFKKKKKDDRLPNENVRNTWLEIKTNKSNYLLVAPYMLIFLTFTVIPVISSMVLSFTYFNLLEFPEWRGWLNYQRLFLEDDIFMIGLKNTLMFAFILGPTSYVLCFLFAWLVNELPPKIRAFMTLLFYAPSICSSVYTIWLYIFSGDSTGLINSYMLKWGWINTPIQFFTNTSYNVGIIIVIQLWLSLGTSFLSFIAGFQSLDKSYFEAGAIDGIKNRFQELIYITIPEMRPQMMFGAVMQIASSFGVGAICRTLGGFPSTDYSLRTIETHIYDYGTTRYEMGYASAIAFLLCIMMIVTRNLMAKLIRVDD